MQQTHEASAPSGSVFSPLMIDVVLLLFLAAIGLVGDPPEDNAEVVYLVVTRTEVLLVEEDQTKQRAASLEALDHLLPPAGSEVHVFVSDLALFQRARRVAQQVKKTGSKVKILLPDPPAAAVAGTS